VLVHLSLVRLMLFGTILRCLFLSIFWERLDTELPASIWLRFQLVQLSEQFYLMAILFVIHFSISITNDWDGLSVSPWGYSIRFHMRNLTGILVPPTTE
jgi:hypothetical protein